MDRTVCEHWNAISSCKTCNSYRTDHEDIILWACGTWCYRYELHEMSYMSDDYQEIKFGTKEHEAISLV